MRAFEFLNEAGEPANPGRRGFLKGLGAAAATAAMPGGVANLAKAAAPAAVAPAAAAVAAPSALSTLFGAAMSHGLDQGWLGHAYSGDVDPEDYEADPELMEPQGEQGEMPWGESYEAKKTPSGKEYLVTSAPYGDSVVFTYLKDGRVHNLEVSWDTSGYGYGEVVSSDDEEDMNIFYDFTEANGEDESTEGELIDAIINGGFEGGAAGGEDDWQSPGPAELARLAGIAKTAAGTTAEPDAKQPAEPKSAEEPAPALPAPGKADVIEPDLQKQKQAVPAKK